MSKDEQAILFPAPAGMNRQLSQAIDAPHPVPRACGDEPLVSARRGRAGTCSPRLRG